MAALSAFVQRRWGSWGILVLGLWSIVLALLAFARLLLLSAVVTINAPENTQGQIWIVFSLNLLFGLAFVASTYGLWTRRRWGRLLFIGCIIFWSIFYVMALFESGALSINDNRPISTLTFNLIPYILGAITSVWYLNLPHIKALFDAKEAANEE